MQTIPRRRLNQLEDIMKKLQYTCKYLVGEDGFRADSKAVAVGSKVIKKHVCCSNEKILDTLVERWTRQGQGIYIYYVTDDDKAYNMKSETIDYCPDSTSTGNVAWYGHQQHDFEHIWIR